MVYISIEQIILTWTILTWTTSPRVKRRINKMISEIKEHKKKLSLNKQINSTTKLIVIIHILHYAEYESLIY